MTTEISRIHQMLQNSWNGPMWHGTNLKEVLADIDFQKAYRKPTAGSHNIYELVMHICCWRNFAIEQLKGNAQYTVVINSETDWPVNYESTEEKWKDALTLLEKSQDELLSELAVLKDEMLEELVPGRKFNWYSLIHGVLHHDIYHSAQISILKK